MTKLKTHHQAGMTAAMKNMFGALSDDFKRRFHRLDMAASLVDINRIRHPDLSIVDAFPAMEGIGPHLGTPVPLNITLVGTDPVAVDAVCASIAGFPVGWVRSVRLGGETGLGMSDLNQIEVQGTPVAAVRRRLQTPLEAYQEQLRGYVALHDAGACSGCACGVATVLMLLLGRHGKKAADLQGLRIHLGKLSRVPDGDEGNVFIVGDCARDCAGHPRYIAGCPPTISDIMQRISPADVEMTSFGPDVTGRPAEGALSS